MNEQKRPGQPVKKNDELPDAVLMAGTLAGNSNGDETSALMRELLLGELAERAKKRQQAIDEFNREQAVKTQALAEERERRRLSQEFCNHRKENMRPNIGGQRLSNGHIAFICQTCFKEWSDNLPPNLQVDLGSIGG